MTDTWTSNYYTMPTGTTTGSNWNTVTVTYPTHAIQSTVASVRAANGADELANIVRRRLGRRVEAAALRDTWGRWTKAAAHCAVLLATHRARQDVARRVARQRRPLRPLTPAKRVRRRTCGASSAYSARPPEAP